MNALLVEDDDLVASTVRRVLQRSRFSVAAHARTPEEALEAFRRAPPELLLLDIGLSGGSDGIELLAALAGHRQVPVVIVSGRTDDHTRERALAARPHAIVYKPFTPEQLLVSVEVAVRSAERLASAEAAQRALRGIASELRRAGMDKSASPGHLTHRDVPEVSAREWEVLELVLDHHSTAEVAAALFISPNTVRNHLKSMYAKLGVTSRSELLARVLQRVR